MGNLDALTKWRKDKMTDSYIKEVGSKLIDLFQKEKLYPFEVLMIMESVKTCNTRF